MASYHRVLNTFGRSAKDKTVECDYDIHPWDILINGVRWDGKGIIVYKDDNAIRNLMLSTSVTAEELGLTVVHQDAVTVAKQKGKDPIPKKGGLDYNITSLGHEVGVKTQYEKTVLKKYVIKIRKGRDATMKRRIRRGLCQHDLFDLMHDAVRLGIITQAELIGFVVGKTIGGSTMEDLSSKYIDALGGASSARNLALEGDRV